MILVCVLISMRSKEEVLDDSGLIVCLAGHPYCVIDNTRALCRGSHHLLLPPSHSARQYEIRTDP